MDLKMKLLMEKLGYFMYMRPVLNMRALFSDGTENYVTPMEPKPGDTVKIRFRTWRDNVDSVFLISGSMRQMLSVEYSDGCFDYYSTEITIGQEAFYYYFEIRSGKVQCFYNRCGVFRDLQQNKPFCIVPGFETPDWAKGAVMYQIYVERFCNGDPSNDVLSGEYSYVGGLTEQAGDWDELPSENGVRKFYGGDLQGVIDKLDYLQELGIQVLYLNPIFVSPSNHKYDIQDYDYVDPHFGVLLEDEGELLEEGDNRNWHATRYVCRVTNKKNLEAGNALFCRLTEEAHRRGMRVILDGVFNHCGSFNKWMDRERIYEGQPGYEPGAYVSADSPYHSFFRFKNEQGWPYNPSYDGWWNYDTLPKLNYESSSELEKYIFRIARKWVSPPYNADGWRLDVAADLGFSSEYNHEFWRKFRETIKAANPDAIVLAEHYGDATAWLGGDQWDTVMNYDAFMEPLSWFFTGMEKHSDEFRQHLRGDAAAFQNTMTVQMAQFLTPSLQVAMNELSNHDHSRFLTRTNGRVGRVENLGAWAACEGVRPEIMREAVVMQMTWPGAPTVYYGDEAGVCGFTDPDNRRTYPWGHEDPLMLAFHRSVIALHRRYPVLTHGSVCFLYGAANCLAYGRFSRTAQIIVVFNNNESDAQMVIPVWRTGIPDTRELMRVFQTDKDGFTEEEQAFPVRNGDLLIRLPGTCAAVLVYGEKPETDGADGDMADGKI